MSQRTKSALDFKVDGTGAMRSIAPHFEKKEMKKVFWIISNSA